ncbi:hypothetical protein P886_0434 [Alteromonadaceae bacterium 2753L.S.0a.02]|nr:hypothetical protein P886_0434 [Alteromonadaceae bacterium 2753L.S.0a.02]
MTYFPHGGVSSFRERQPGRSLSTEVNSRLGSTYCFHKKFLIY